MSMNTNNVFNTGYRLGVFNSGQDPHENNQNGFRCRFCNRAFFTLQALTIHFESHFAPQNPVMRSMFSPNHVNSQRETIFNPLQPNFPRSMVMPEARNFVNNRVFQAPPPQPMVMLRPRTNSFPYAIQQPLQQGSSQAMISAMNNVTERARLSAPPIIQREMDISPIDGTKPYINLLDKPINNNEFFNRAIINGDALDLALRI